MSSLPSSRYLIIVDGGGKGGVGKTTTACAILESLRRRNIPRVRGFDTDGAGEGARFTRAYPDLVTPVNPFDTRSMDRILNELLQEASSAVYVIDVGGGLDTLVHTWITKAGPMTAAQKGHISLQGVFVLTALRQSVERLKHYVDYWTAPDRSEMDLAVLRNLGIDSTFDAFDDGPTAQRIRRRGWPVADFPALNKDVAIQVEHWNAPFHSYIEDDYVGSERATPTIGFRDLANGWLTEAMTVIDEILPLPGLASANDAERSSVVPMPRQQPTLKKI